MQRRCVLAYLGVACVLTYSVVIPFTAIEQISTQVAALRAPRRLSPRVLSRGQSVNAWGDGRQSVDFERWTVFWDSSTVHDLEAVQQLKRGIEHLRYQRLSKDVEYQDTAGLDVVVAVSLKELYKDAETHKTQEWLRSQMVTETFASISRQQFPNNCSEVKKLYCKLGKSCGFGCELHHAAHCLSVAVATNRTMIMQVSPSNYIKDTGTWEQMFAPLSSCSLEDLHNGARPTLTTESGLQEAANEIFVDIIDNDAMEFDAPAMPHDVLDVVKLFHTKPHIWWQGVLISWLLQPSQQSIKRQEDFRTEHFWASPVAGVHIRRTDKLASEAKLHHVAEYMTHVERFCDVNCQPGWQERARQAQQKPGSPDPPTARAGLQSECSVYLASDEESTVAEVKTSYSHINVLTKTVGARTGSLQARYTSDGLLGIYDDILHLAHTDFLVGTFSSQVSRLAYEIAQVNTSAGVIDASFNYHSVDSQWYFGGQQQYHFCLAHDYTDVGARVLAAGQQVICPVIYQYNSGYMSCQVPGTAQQTKVPPGSLVPCKGLNGRNWCILPRHMRRPALQK